MIDLTLNAKKCEHDVWHPHNALRLEDGTTVDDPAGSCPGGVVEVEGCTFHIWLGLARALDYIETQVAS